MTRPPLSETSGQARTRPQAGRTKRSHTRAYGKGGTASSRAVLSDHLFDENEIEKQMFRMEIGGNASSHSPQHVAKTVFSVSPAVPKVTSPNQKGTKTRRTPILDSAAAAYTSPLLAECHKPKPVWDFGTWASKVAAAFKVIKVGEGSYGEVFKLDTSDQVPTAARRKPTAHRDCIFKLIPLRAKGNQSNNQTGLDALVREVQLLKLMDPVPGFARFRDLTVLQGQYPASFAQAFYDYQSIDANDSNSLEPSDYSEKQLWVMIEMDDAGEDLESLKAPSAYQIFDIFWLTCCALSYAEDYAEFEHRDLHMGNICVKSSKPNEGLDIPADLNANMQSDDFRTSFGRSGIRPTIIDYTLSRARTTHQNKEHQRKVSTSAVLYDPFKMPGIFTGRGKTVEEDSQRQVYRDMQIHALAFQKLSRAEDTSRQNRKLNEWARFIPRTTVLWLAYLLSTLLARSGNAILEHSSLASEQAQVAIYETMRRTLDMLRGSKGIAGQDRTQGTSPAPRSASDVVAIAQRDGLLTSADLEAIKENLERECY